jgi:hypothetical protein
MNAASQAASGLPLVVVVETGATVSKEVRDNTKVMETVLEE